MLVEGSERTKAFSTFKHEIVGCSFYPKRKKTVDSQMIVCYNRYLDSNKVFKHMHMKAQYTLMICGSQHCQWQCEAGSNPA